MFLRLRACFRGIEEAEGLGNVLPSAADAQDAQPARNSAACNFAKDSSASGSRLQVVTAFRDDDEFRSRPCHDIRTARRCLEAPIDPKNLAHTGETGVLGSRACFQRQSTPDVLTPTCDVHDTTPMAEIDVQLRCSAVPAPRTEVPNAASRPGRAAPSAGSHLRPALPPSLTLLAAQGSSGAAESRLLAKLVKSTLRPTAPESQGADGAGGSAAAAVATIRTTAAATAADTGGYNPPAAENVSTNGECLPGPQLGSSLSVGGARVKGGDTGGNGAGLYMGGGNDTEEAAMAAATPAAAPAAAAVPATAAATPVLHLQIPRSLSEPTPTGRCLHRCGTLPTVMPVAAEVAAAELAPAVAAAVAATEPLPRSVQHVTTVAPRLQLPRDGVAAASAAAAESSACNGHAAASAEQQQVLPPALLSRRRHPRVASRVQGPLLAATCDRIAAVDEVGVAPTDTAAAAAGVAGLRLSPVHGYGSHLYTDAAGLDGDDEEDDEDEDDDEDAADEDADENEMSHVIRHVMRMARRHHVQESRAACSRLLQVLEPAGRGNAAGASASGSAATGAAAGSKLAGTAPTMPVAEPVAATVVEAAAAHASHLKCSSSSAAAGGGSDEAQRASYSLSALHYGNSIAAMAVGNGASFCAISSCEVASEDVSAEMAALAAAMAHQQQQQPGQAVAAAAAAGGLALVGGGSVAGAEVGGWVERVSRTSLNEALHDRQREVAAGLAAAAAAARGPSGGAAAAVPAYTSRRRTEALSGMCAPPVAEAGVDNRASSQVALMRLLRIGEPAPAFAQGGGQPYANDGRNLGQHHPAGAAAAHALAPLLPGERPQAQPLPQQLRGVSWLCRNLSGLKWLGEGGGGVVFQAVWHGAHVAVKLMAADVAAHVDATALEAVVGLALGHPNVVTTYCADVCLMTESMELMLHSLGVDSFSPTGMASSMSDGPFTSGDGFGEPDPAKTASAHRKDQIWSLRQVLSHLGVRPGRHLTWMVMEHCDRGSLMQAIQRGIFRMPEPQTQAAAAAAAAAAANRDSPLPFSRRVVLRALLRTAREVAQGMCHLHANGIIHGDLKPGNVLLRGCRNDRRGFCALVSDFGLSKVTPGGQAVVAHNWSTVTAQAPETFAGQWLPASDVWSFGILLWQLVAGEDVPYRHLAVHEVAAGVSLGLLVPEWTHDTHPSVLALGHACLSLSPQRRPTFNVIVKALIEIEQSVRNEARASASATNSSEQQ